MCGLATLDWEARQERATQILSNNEWKQKLCNDLIGLSFRELERTLSGIASERQKKEESDERKRNGSRQKPMRGSSPVSGHETQPLPRRTLAEILAQVYAPRQSETLPRGEEDQRLLAFYRQAATGRSEALLSLSDDGTDCLEKSTD